MTRFRSLLASVPALIVAGTILSADIIPVTLTGAGPVNDGSDYVLPYELGIGGLGVGADCYDFFDQVQIGQTWDANLLTLSEAAAYGQFSGSSDALTGYEEVAWLSAQATSTPQDQVDLQHAIWDVFDPNAFVLPADQFLSGVLGAEAAGIASFDFDNYQFLEAVRADDGSLGQAFVLYVPGSGQNPVSPEPACEFLLAAGAALIGIYKLCQLGGRGGNRLYSYNVQFACRAVFA